jgi:hypothetical protein
MLVGKKRRQVDCAAGAHFGQCGAKFGVTSSTLPSSYTTTLQRLHLLRQKTLKHACKYACVLC